MKITTLRAQGFRFVKLAGPLTSIKHTLPFLVNGKPARPLHGGKDGFEFNCRGWFDVEITRDIVVGS